MNIIYMLNIFLISNLAAVAGLANDFRYDEKTGKCVNSRGETGRNSISLQRAAETKDGECGDFRGQGAVSGHPFCERSDATSMFNLRGADLTGFALSFCHAHADLSGAILTGIKAGYSSLTGRGDAFTIGFDGKPVAPPYEIRYRQ